MQLAQFKLYFLLVKVRSSGRKMLQLKMSVQFGKFSSFLLPESQTDRLDNMSYCSLD